MNANSEAANDRKNHSQKWYRQDGRVSCCGVHVIRRKQTKKASRP